jgi:hypothetical protein
VAWKVEKAAPSWRAIAGSRKGEVMSEEMKNHTGKVLIFGRRTARRPIFMDKREQNPI